MKLSHLIIAGLSTLGLITLVSGFYTVDEGEVTVIKTLGKISAISNPGAHYRIPFITSGEKISTKQQVFDPEPMASAVKAKQVISINTSVDYSITNPSLYVSTYTPESLRSKLSRLQQEAVKNVTLQYSLDEAIGDKRQEISDNIQSVLVKAVLGQNLPITINNLTVENISPPAAIAEAIQRTTVAMQDAKTAEQLKTKATNEAEAAVIKAQGEAKANAVIAKSLKEDGAKVVEVKALEVQEKAIAKWNGVLPTTTAGGTVPFLNINK